MRWGPTRFGAAGVDEWVAEGCEGSGGAGDWVGRLSGWSLLGCSPTDGWEPVLTLVWMWPWGVCSRWSRCWSVGVLG